MKSYLQNNLEAFYHTGILDELPLWSAPFGLKLMDSIDYISGIKVLDIGSGSGFLVTELAQRLGTESMVYGIDPDSASNLTAQRKIDLFKINNIQLINGVAESIPLPDATIDLITSNNGINNVQDIDKVFQECARIIKPSGQFIQTMNTDQTMFEFYDELIDVLKEMEEEQIIDRVHLQINQKRPSLEFMRKKLRESGFILRDQIQDHFSYKFANGTSMLNHFFIRLAFMDSWKKLLPEEKQELIFNSIESRLNEKSKTLGYLQLSVPFVLLNAYRAT